jgi:heptosyltransferase I
MTLNFKPPLQHVCLLRISAIGDTCHALAALRAFQAAWPRTRFTWIIGKLEAKLMTAILPEIEFITFDKSATLKELWRLRRALRGRRFDLLLDLQLSFRASLISSLVSAPIKLGFDRQRARELQWWFTNARIAPATKEHVLDSFMGFARACGIEPGPPRWDIELPPETLERSKTGFGVPLDRWFREELCETAADLLLGGPDRGLFKRSELKRLLGEHSSAQADHGHRLWCLCTLELWQRRYID